MLISTVCFSQERQLSLNSCMYPFYHGVASGDPKSDRVIIWTRVTPDTNFTGQINVDWRVATDTSMQNVVSSGTVITDNTSDFTVKADATGLTENTWYYYEFSALGVNSIRGRTRTTPSGNSDSLRFAVVSCANYEAGFFNAYKVIKERNDIDAVIALGDYIYEYESGGYSPNPTAGREWLPQTEITTLTDYRTRYSTYHLDEDLMRLHQQYPFIVIWDDHESANDSWKNGAENHTEVAEGFWGDRKLYAKQAFFEWLPIRQTGSSDPYQIFRNISFGNLAEFIMLDTRLHGRDEQDGTSGAIVEDANRQLLGADQFSWLGNRLSNSGSQWKILAQQVMMAPLEVFGIAVNGDQWDGYPAERERVYDYIFQNNINDVVVLTGDIHSSWANDLPASGYDPNLFVGSAGVEFVTPSVTSPGLDFGVASSVIQASNNHIKYADLTQHGFVLLDINQTRTQADWYYVNTIDQSSNQYSHGASFYVNESDRYLHPSAFTSVPRPALTNTIQAPDCPREFSTTGMQENKLNVLGVYPNPSFGELSFQVEADGNSNVSIEIYDLNGKKICSYDYTVNGINVIVLHMDISDLPKGMYLAKIVNGRKFSTLRFILE